MKSSSLVFGTGVAIISAAVANPIVEFAANSGWLGAGAYTDHSNLDVVPALLAGVGVLALYLARKAHAILAGGDSSGAFFNLLPVIFALQLLVLFIMETSEQLVVWRHVLGPTVWLGAPVPISAAIHAAICCTVAFAIARSKRTLAATTLRVIRLIRAIATLCISPVAAPAGRRFTLLCSKELLPVLCTIGERAPPRQRNSIK